ncbi:hypothetical protein H0W80_03745 [Candidatus Saccharibacteria bacterium]|nr:hypothetical protein [Candidatus Saccharibacteria bacterium]
MNTDTVTTVVDSTEAVTETEVKGHKPSVVFPADWARVTPRTETEVNAMSSSHIYSVIRVIRHSEVYPQLYMNQQQLVAEIDTIDPGESIPAAVTVAWKGFIRGFLKKEAGWESGQRRSAWSDLRTEVEAMDSFKLYVTFQTNASDSEAFFAAKRSMAELKFVLGWCKKHQFVATRRNLQDVLYTEGYEPDVNIASLSLEDLRHLGDIAAEAQRLTGSLGLNTRSTQQKGSGSSTTSSDQKKRQAANKAKRAADNRARAAQHPKGAKPGLFTKKN